MVGSHRESWHSEQRMGFEFLSKVKTKKFQETHIIGHAQGNDDITKHSPNNPCLRGDIIR